MVDNVILSFNILVTLLIVILSFYYFYTTKTKYRWVKLFWGLEILVYLLILLISIFGGHVTKTTQYLSMLLPLSCLLYGLVVSFTRKKEEKFFSELLEKHNGELERWMITQINAKE